MTPPDDRARKREAEENSPQSGTDVPSPNPESGAAAAENEPDIGFSVDDSSGNSARAATEKSPAKSSAKKTPAKKSAAKKAPAKEAKAKEAPAKDAVAGEAPVPDAPAQEEPEQEEPAPASSELPAETRADPTTRAQDLAAELGRQLSQLAPEGWVRLAGVFAFTTVREVGQVQFVNAEDQVVRIRPPKTVFEVVRAHREVSAELGDGPWWRLLVRLTPGGEPEIGQDYGEEPFPPDQLFPAEAYAEDLETYPRDRLPVWLAAHIGHGDRQVRTPRDAAIDAIVGGPAAVLSEADFPPLTLLWARWAVISAAFVAIQSQLGPRVQPSLGWFEGSRRSGSTLFILPDGRAVLSGGVWNAPALDAAYNGGTELPDLYAGAPDWVADPVLDHRANKGLLSFCYWWDGSDWYKGDSPAAEHLSAAVPGIWTADTTVDVISALIDEDRDDEVRTAVADLVSAAEAGIVTRANLTEAFGDGEYWDLDEDDDEDLDFYDGEDRDLDGAFMQLTMAGLTITTPEEPMPEEEAIARVRDYILENNIDTTGYPLENLRADRLDVGWMVYVPTRPGEIAIGRAIFYIADDGVLEPSSSSIAPSRYIEAFEQRFHTRHGTVPA